MDDGGLARLIDLGSDARRGGVVDHEQWCAALVDAWHDPAFVLDSHGGPEIARFWLTQCAEFLDRMAVSATPNILGVLREVQTQRLVDRAHRLIDHWRQRQLANDAVGERVVVWDALALSIAFSHVRLLERRTAHERCDPTALQALADEGQRLLRLSHRAGQDGGWIRDLALHVLDEAGDPRVRARVSRIRPTARWREANRARLAHGEPINRRVDVLALALAQDPRRPVPTASPRLVSSQDAFWRDGRSAGHPLARMRRAIRWRRVRVTLIVQLVLGILLAATAGRIGQGPNAPLTWPLFRNTVAESTSLLLGLCAVVATITVALAIAPEPSDNGPGRAKVEVWVDLGWLAAFMAAVLAVVTASANLLSWQPGQVWLGLHNKLVDVALAVLCATLASAVDSSINEDERRRRHARMTRSTDSAYRALARTRGPSVWGAATIGRGRLWLVHAAITAFGVLVLVARAVDVGVPRLGLQVTGVVLAGGLVLGVTWYTELLLTTEQARLLNDDGTSWVRGSLLLWFVHLAVVAVWMTLVDRNWPLALAMVVLQLVTWAYLWQVYGFGRRFVMPGWALERVRREADRMVMLSDPVRQAV